MRLLRLVLAGLIAATVLVAGFFAAAVIVVAGLVAYLMQLIWKRNGSVQAGPRRGMNRASGMRTDDVIDVVATKVPADQSEI